MVSMNEFSVRVKRVSNYLNRELIIRGEQKALFDLLFVASLCSTGLYEEY